MCVSLNSQCNTSIFNIVISATTSYFNYNTPHFWWGLFWGGLFGCFVGFFFNCSKLKNWESECKKCMVGKKVWNKSFLVIGIFWQVHNAKLTTGRWPGCIPAHLDDRPWPWRGHYLHASFLPLWNSCWDLQVKPTLKARQFCAYAHHTLAASIHKQRNARGCPLCGSKTHWNPVHVGDL